MREIVRDAFGNDVNLAGILTTETMVRFEMTSRDWPAKLSYTTPKETWLNMSRDAKIDLLQTTVREKLLEEGISA